MGSSKNPLFTFKSYPTYIFRKIKLKRLPEETENPKKEQVKIKKNERR